MSVRFQDELLIRLTPLSSRVELWRRGWSAAPRAKCAAAGSGAAALNRCLQRIQEEGRRIPKRARLLVDEPLAVLATAEAHDQWSEARARARVELNSRHTAAAIQSEVYLLPGRRLWLGVAMESDRAEAWEASLRAAGVSSVRLELSLFESLSKWRERLADFSGLVGLVRDASITFLRLENGAVTSLAVERHTGEEPGDLLPLVERHANPSPIERALLAAAGTARVEAVKLIWRAPPTQATRAACLARGWSVHSNRDLMQS